MTNASVVEEPEVRFDYSAEAELFPARNRKSRRQEGGRPHLETNQGNPRTSNVAAAATGSLDGTLETSR